MLRSPFWFLCWITLCFNACSDDGLPTPPKGSDLEPTTDVVLEGVLTYDRIDIPPGVAVRASGPN
ncbi:MAG: hypothetical protein U0527_14565 [Candidatus Eisenbacteria bacterium]